MHFKRKCADLTAHSDRQRGQLNKRRSELHSKQERLLEAFLTGAIDESVFRGKTDELKRDVASVEQSLAQLNEPSEQNRGVALDLFNWTQNASESWSRSKMPLKREILISLSLNRTLSDVSLVTTKRKPFDVLAEGPFLLASGVIQSV